MKVKRVTYFALCVFLPTLLCGCLTQEQRREKQQQQQELREEAHLRSLQKRCDSFGFKRETPEYSNCMMAQAKEDNLNAYRNGVLKNQDEERQRKAWRDVNDSLKPTWVPQVTIQNN